MLKNANTAKIQIRCHRIFIGILKTSFRFVNINDIYLRPFRAQIFGKFIFVIFIPHLTGEGC